jgi:hypothetical protein
VPDDRRMTNTPARDHDNAVPASDAVAGPSPRGARRPRRAGHASRRPPRGRRQESGTRPRYRLTEPGDLIAAVPALLGFVPKQSIVVLSVDGPARTTVAGVMRIDVVYSDAEGNPTDDWRASVGRCHEDAMTGLLERIAHVQERNQVGGAVVIIVEENCAEVQHGELARMARDALAACGVELVQVLSVPVVAEGAPWTCLHPRMRSGIVPDPQASPIAAALVLSGQVIRADRAEYDTLIAPGPQSRRDSVALEIEHERPKAQLERQLGGRAALRRELDHVLTQIANLASGACLEAPELARLAIAIAHPLVRDRVCPLALTECAEDAERLWLTLARELPDHARAEALVLSAFSAYVRGDGAFAATALAAALRCDPFHRMAGMLDCALSNGMAPAEVASTADVGWELARELGIELPPRRYLG